MSYASIDTLQTMLKEQVFAHTLDAKKAAGRALGTVVELITFYMLREWGLHHCASIERGLPEYGNAEITHNVEFMLHPIRKTFVLASGGERHLTSGKILKALSDETLADFTETKGNTLLDRSGILRNCCLLAEGENCILEANLGNGNDVLLSDLYKHPFAMIECKRVGVEEGCKKGPQTIEKAKQGAYVAGAASSLQKVRNDRGELCGLMFVDGIPKVKPYAEMLDEAVSQDGQLKGFTLTIGIVSNHGNWFTAENKNKEMKVLAQAYDWLLFLTDDGLARFITDLLLQPLPRYAAVAHAFVDSYRSGRKANVFTKTKIDLAAHTALCEYFAGHRAEIESWFNVITPAAHDIGQLRSMLYILRDKNWRKYV